MFHFSSIWGFLFFSILNYNFCQAQSCSAIEMPYFAGCSHLKPNSKTKRECSNEQLKSYLTTHLQYPDTARLLGIEGRVYSEFEVNEAGMVQNIVILSDIGGGCGQEAKRIIETMPTWEAATKDKQNIAIKLYLPIVFSLDEERNRLKNYQIVWGNAQDTLDVKNLKDYVNTPIVLRDILGNNHHINALKVQFAKGKKIEQAESTGTMNATIVRLLNHIKSSGDLTFEVEILEKGKVLSLSKHYVVTKSLL